jgi:hypothetical protein
MNGELITDYRWALNQLKAVYNLWPNISPKVILTDAAPALLATVAEVFPDAAHLLCTWHATQAIEVHCRPLFYKGKTAKASKQQQDAWEEFEKHWKKVLWSQTKEEYKDNWTHMRRKYGRTKHASSILYIQDEWLTPNKEKLIAAWTNLHMHFGQTTSNIAEGLYALIKLDLPRCSGDLYLL